MGLRDIFFQVSQQSMDEFRYFIEERCGNISEEWNEKLSKLPIVVQ